MARQYTEQELQQLIEAEKILRDQGLIVDEKDGTELATHNAERVKAYFELNPQISINVSTVVNACEDMHDQMHWKPVDQVRFENIYAILTSQEMDAFNSWVRPQRLINNHKNNAIILAYLKNSQRYEVNYRTLLQAAVDRIPMQLEWLPTPHRVDPRQHVDDGTGFLRDERNPRYRNGRVNHAYKEPGKNQEPPKNLDPSEAQWKSMAEGLRGNTHSKNAELDRIHGKNWRETYELRKKALKQNPVTISRFGVA